MIRPQRRFGGAIERSSDEFRARDEPAATAREPLAGVRGAGVFARCCDPLGRC
jgi:hypothetical protein